MKYDFLPHYHYCHGVMVMIGLNTKIHLNTLPWHWKTAHLGAPRRVLRGNVMVTCHGNEKCHGSTVKSTSKVMVIPYRRERRSVTQSATMYSPFFAVGGWHNRLFRLQASDSVGFCPNISFNQVYRDSLNGALQVWWKWFLLLFTCSAWPFLGPS